MAKQQKRSSDSTFEPVRLPLFSAAHERSGEIELAGAVFGRSGDSSLLHEAVRMQLANRIHLVGSGSFGFDLSDPYDCHVYLVDGGSELALVDVGAGIGSASGALLDCLRLRRAPRRRR